MRSTRWLTTLGSYDVTPASLRICHTADAKYCTKHGRRHRESEAESGVRGKGRRETGEMQETRVGLERRIHGIGGGWRCAAVLSLAAEGVGTGI